jgi:inhibitor of KinA sporulation pathway (predicted exonuclease)
MPYPQFQFDFAPRTKMRVTDAIRMLEKHRVFTDVPCRETMIGWILDGTLDGKKIGDIWYLYVDTFEVWVRSLDEPEKMRRAA